MSPESPIRKNILIVNANWMGDVLFSSPALRALRRQYPSSRIVCLVPARVVALLENNPSVDEVLVYNDRVSFVSWPEMLRVVREIRKRRFDTAIFFHRSKTKVWMVRQAGVRERIGYSTPGRDALLTQAVTMPGKPMHRIDHYLGLLEKAGIPTDGRHMEYFPPASAAPELSKIMDAEGVPTDSGYFVVHAGGNWDLKRWPIGHFVSSIGLLCKEFSLKAVLCGTAGEKDICDRILSGSEAGQVVSLCSRTSLGSLALLLKNARFLLSNDSGPIHLAASQRTPIIGLFGPTDPAITGPISLGPMRLLHKDVGCDVPCYFKTCEHRVCMEWLTPDEVLAAAREVLRG